MRRFLLAERPINTTYMPLEDGRQAVFFKSDLTDLEKVRYYVAHDDERERIATGAREFLETFVRR